jgi:acyl-CoA thioester hydrolase
MPRRTNVRLTVPEGGDSFVGFAPLARLLETAATTASTEAGFPPEWYLASGTVWVIRRSRIECLSEIGAGTALEIRTWVGDFRRVRSIREYEAYRSGALVLRARTDWVYVELPAAKPRRVPEAMMNAFVPEGCGTLPREPLALGEPSAAGLETLEWSVAIDDLDRLGHVNNAKYFDYVESTARALVGGDRRPRTHDVEYVDEARAGERLRATAWLLDATSDASELATEIRRAANGAVVTRARSRFVAR